MIFSSFIPPSFCPQVFPLFIPSFLTSFMIFNYPTRVAKMVSLHFHQYQTLFQLAFATMILCNTPG